MFDPIVLNEFEIKLAWCNTVGEGTDENSLLGGKCNCPGEKSVLVGENADTKSWMRLVKVSTNFFGITLDGFGPVILGIPNTVKTYADLREWCRNEISSREAEARAAWRADMATMRY